MKRYLLAFGLLAVIVAVAVWPKSDGRPDPVEKKPGGTPPTGGPAVEDDIPASTGDMKVTAHRRRAGEPGEDGWYGAESTQGGFAVRLPNVFNDLTVTSNSRDGTPVTMHSVGTRTEANVQYSVTKTNRRDTKSVQEAMESVISGLGPGITEKVPVTQAGISGVQIKAVVGPSAGIGRLLVNESTIYMLMVENRAGVVITPEMEQNAPIFFESFRLK